MAFAAAEGPFEPSGHFAHLGREDGLSHFSVQDVLQDRRGFMWFATRSGLDRYDGHVFRSYRSVPGESGTLSYGSLNCLLEDRRGVLWIGTDGGGIDRMVADRGTFETYLPDREGGLGSRANRITSLSEDPEGRIWAGTFHGLFLLDPSDGSFVSFRAGDGGLTGEEVFSVFVEDRRTVWVGTGAGLERLDPTSGEVAHFPVGSPHSIVADPRGGLWVGTENRGLVHFEPGEGDGEETAEVVRSILPELKVRDLFATPAAVLWIGSATGLTRFDVASGEEQSFEPDPLNPGSLSYENVTAVFEDAAGIVWATTWGGGVNKLDGRATRVDRARHRPEHPGSLSQDEVMSILEDRNGTLWVGTWRGGLNRLDRGASGFRVYRADPGIAGAPASNRVAALLEDHLGRLWIGTRGGGVHRYDRSTDRFEVFPQESDPSARVHMIHALAEDGEGRIWMGTSGGGLVRFEPESGVFETFRNGSPEGEGLGDHDAWALLPGEKGLWVGTSAGLRWMDWESERFTAFRADAEDAASLPHDRVNCLLRDHAGRLWVGTDGGGLTRVDGAGRTARFRTFAETEGLASSSVKSLVEGTTGFLWVGTDRGFSRFDPESGTFRNFGVSAGAQRNGYFANSALLGSDGLLYLGGLEGLTRVDPERLGEPAPPPRVVLTSFLLSNREVELSTPERPTPLKRPVDLSDELVIDYDRFPLAFEFAALQYGEPRDHRFLYRLDGLDDEWIPTDASNRRASYSALSPGRYTFRVRGANADGVWSEEEASVRVVVRAPWWMTNWARGGSVALLVLLVLVVQWGRLRRSEQTRLHLERRVEERTAELAEANLRLEDSLRTDYLTGLPNRRGFLELAGQEIAAARRTGKPFSLGLGDIDRFKEVNDTYGHEAGDEVLRNVGTSLRESLRERDLVARWGGEEFVFLFPETELEGARVVAEKVRKAVAATTVPVDGEVLSVTLTLGISLAGPDEPIDIALARADRALYRGKDRGRDRVEVAGSDAAG